MNQLISGLSKLSMASVLVVTLVACGGAEERKIKYLEKGKAYLAEKNYDKAKIELKNVLQIDPKFADAYYLMGQLEDAKNEPRRAIGNYKKAISLDPKHSDAKIGLARIYTIAGTVDFIEEAKKLLEQVKQDGKTNFKSKLISATIDYKAGDKTRAVSDLKELVNSSTDNSDAVSLLSSIYISEGKDDEAIKILKDGINKDPENIPLRIAIAKLLAKIKDFNGAEKYLKEAVNIDTDRFALHVALSSFYATSNQLDKAESVLRTAIDKNPDDAQRYLVLVEFLSTRVNVKEANDELLKAIEKHPDLYDLKFAQVKFYNKIGKSEDAKAVLQKIISDKSYDLEGVTARIQLADQLFEEGNHLASKKYIDEVLSEFPNNNGALLIKSKLSLADLDAVSAINGLRTVVKNDPKNAEASLLLAKSHELNNESGLAEDQLKKAIESNPVNDQVHINYANYLLSKGRTDEGISVIDKALTYFKDSYGLLELKLKTIASGGDEKQILLIVDRMEQVSPLDPDVNIVRGQFYLSKKQIDKGIEQFESAYEKANSKYRPLDLIIQTYVKTNQVDKAKARLDEILSVNNSDPVANQVKGQLHLLLKEIELARKHFKASADAFESWFKPYSNIASTYIMENNSDMAISVLKDSLPKLKNTSPAKMMIASIYERDKKYTEAMSVYDEIIKENPSNKIAANNYASLLLDYGTSSDATKALNISKGFSILKQPALLDTLGWAYAKTGDTAKAIEVLKPVVDKAPNVAVFRYHLGYALYQTGDTDAAKSHLEIAVSSEQLFPGKDKAKELLKNI